MNVSPSSQVSNVIVTANGGELPNAKLLRLLRLGRVVRLFKTLKSLNRLITAVSKAVVPVCNAFLILFIIAAIYAILGTNFFGEQSPEFFLNFKTSLFTMFQVLSGDGWSDLARSLFAHDETDTTGIRKTDSSVAFFFVSYMLINSIMLLNVVVAVLLVPLFTCAYAYAHAYTYAHTYTYEHAYTSCICIRIYTGRVHFKCDARKAGGGARDTCRAGQTQTAAQILISTPYNGFT
jgi:hypothetical protein